MKKLVVLAASILLCTLAQAQGADDSGTSAGITIVPRIDVNPTFAGSEKEVTLGNSSLYTLFEGNITENLSFSVCNHWLSSEPKYLYQNTWRADDVNWCDWAYLEYSLGNFIITAGKQVITFGGFELEEYDFDVHPDMMTGLFNNFQCYQWGGKVSYTTPSELSTFSLQMTTSPFGEHPFASGLWTYSAQWSGEYDWYSPLWSATAFGTEPGQYTWLFSLGNMFTFGDFSLTLDWSNTAGMTEEYDDFMKGSTFHGVFQYAPSERWDFGLRGNYVITPRDIMESNWWNLGGVVQFYPLFDSQDLRLHAFAAYDSLLGGFQLCAGILYNLSFKLW